MKIGQMLRRKWHQFGWWLVPRLIAHFRWHGTVLDTDVPNVNCLKVTRLEFVNSYGQTRVWPRGGAA